MGLPVKVGETKLAFSVSNSLMAACTVTAEIPPAGVLAMLVPGVPASNLSVFRLLKLASISV